MEGNKKKITAYISEYAAFIALVLLVLVLGCISPEFRTASNFLNLLRQATFNGLIAFGMTCVILSDGIDLSVGSTFALSAIICAEMLIAGIPASIAILAALAVGTALGAVSGLLVTKGRLQPFIATLITMTAYRGLAMIITEGKPISRLAASIKNESGAFLFKMLGKGKLVGVRDPRRKIVGSEYGIRLDLVKLCERSVPELIKVTGSWISSLVNPQLFKWHINNWHFIFSLFFR